MEKTTLERSGIRLQEETLKSMKSSNDSMNEIFNSISSKPLPLTTNYSDTDGPIIL